MRLRLPELLAERGWTAYQLHAQAGGRLSMSTAYRILRDRGRVTCFDAELLETLCDVFGVGPAELFERERKPPKRGK